LDEKIWIYQKKKQFLYAERSEAKRKCYQDELATLNLDDIVYLDESGMDDNEVNQYGYGLKGKRVMDEKRAEKQTRISIIGALNKNRFFAPFVFEGSCNRDVFTIYITEVLAECIHPGMTIVLDNASFHKGGSILEIIKTLGCNVLYLPPYSPDFNPIEHFWASIKYKMKNVLKYTTPDIFQASIITFSNISI
jgi:transposase